MIKPLEVLGLSLTSTLGNSRESKVVYGPLEIHPLEISMGPWEFQTKTHGNSTIFSLSPLEIPLLLVYKRPLWEFLHAPSFLTPGHWGNSMSSITLPYSFFSPTAYCPGH